MNFASSSRKRRNKFLDSLKKQRGNTRGPRITHKYRALLRDLPGSIEVSLFIDSFVCLFFNNFEKQEAEKQSAVTRHLYMNGAFRISQMERSSMIMRSKAEKQSAVTTSISMNVVVVRIRRPFLRSAS